MYEIAIVKKEIKNYRRREWRKVTDNVEANDQYQYVDDDWSKEVEIPILTQNVEEIDLPAVIKAVNKL